VQAQDSECGAAGVMKILLHVGPHKTGSSYLQACFVHHKESLRGRRILLPSAWEHARGNPSHTGLVKALLDNDLAGVRAVIDGAIAEGGETLLVSAEDLSVLPVEALQRLRLVLGDAEVLVVFYVRRWTDFLPSAWQELIRQGKSMSLPEYFSLQIRNPAASEELNIELKLANLIEVFGQDSIRLVCFSMLVDSGTDIFSHFARHFLDWWQAEPPPGAPRHNASRGVREIELLRQLNAIEFAATGRQSVEVRNKLDAAAPSKHLEFVLGAMEPHYRTLPFNDFLPALTRMHQALHERFKQNIVRPSPPNMFFRPKKHPLPYVASNYLLQRGVVDALHEIHMEIMQ
jgi:hypothetical protein